MKNTERVEMQITLRYSRTIGTPDPETDQVIGRRPCPHRMPPCGQRSVLEAIPMGPVSSDCEEVF
jgi:hypothetical protein